MPQKMPLQPPPPPPPPRPPGSTLKVRISSTAYFRPIDTQEGDTTTPAPTGPYFCYGTLTDPSMLREILALPVDPELRPAYILGSRCKLWGHYPALVDASSHSDSRVEGAVYVIKTVEHGEKLAEYETRNYRAESCRILYSDGEKPEQEDGWTFKFVGDQHALADGVFDLRVWLRRMGRHAEIEKLDAKKEKAA